MIAYRTDIDGLRAVAIISVVTFHARPDLLPGGFTGVDIFFVISGFLITKMILTENAAGEFSFLQFWVRRARRILPALSFMLLVVTATAFVVLMPVDLVEYGSLLTHALGFAANIFLSSEAGYFAPEAQSSPLHHVWSLSVEEQYYLVWPILIVLLVRNLSPKLVLAVMCSLLAASLAYSEWASVNAPKLGFYGLPSRGFELLTGALLAALNLRGPSAWAARVASVAGLLVLCFGFFFIDEASRFPGLLALIPVAGAAILIFSGNSNSSLANRILSTRAAVFIGKISYSWYLWHWPPLAFARYYFERPLDGLELAAIVLFGFVMAVISYRYIEAPFRRAAPLKEFAKGFLPVAAACSVVLLCAAVSFQYFKGVPGRLGADTVAVYGKFDGANATGCDGGLKKIGQYLHECEFGGSPAVRPTMLLWGDSHAQHYLPAIASLASANGVRGILRTTADCRPLLGAEQIDSGTRRRRQCPVTNEETLAMVRANPDISLVMLAARWSKKEIAAAPSEHLAVFERNLEKTIVILRQMGKTVALLGQVPERPVSLRDCMTKQFHFGIRVPGCEVSGLSDRNPYEMGVWTVMRRLAEKHASTLFSPEKHLCDTATCRATDDRGEPLYSDVQHLTPGGAYFLQTHMSPAIAPLLRESRSAFVTTVSQ